MAEALYRDGGYRDGAIDASLAAVAEYASAALARSQPMALQIVWDDVLEFIFGRFQLFRAQKANHPQWDPEGHHLYDLMKGARRDLERSKFDVRAQFFATGAPAKYLA